MRFDLPAFLASTRPTTAEESRAHMAEVVAGLERDERYVSVERDFDDELAEMQARLMSR